MKTAVLKFFIGMTPYHINANIVHVFFKINLRSFHQLLKYFYNENFQSNSSLTSNEYGAKEGWRLIIRTHTH